MHSSSLSGKKIILGITGSIAAYKSALLARLFVKQGAEVKVVMTKAAGHFISPLTLSTLSNNDVEDSLFSDGSWSNHVELGLWADLMIIAPLSANTLGKMANGICDNMLMATYLSAKCPVYFAPAMDLDMWIHPSTQNNIEKLLSYGNKFIPVGEGFLASGLSGKGRMAEPEDIIEFIAEDVTGDLSLKGKRVLVTAGPTYEPIDPVRFIGNHSSGKMGYAITDYLAKCGATVELVTGPSKLTPPDHPSVNVHKVMTGQEMFEITKELFPKMDGGIFAAAVADYTPKVVADEKIKKKTDSFQLEMVKNPDIAKFIGEHKKEDQMTIGFALETQNGMKNADRKLQSKNLNMIVLNTLGDEGVGFNYDTNKVTFIKKDNKVVSHELKSKQLVAVDIVKELISLFND